MMANPSWVESIKQPATLSLSLSLFLSVSQPLHSTGIYRVDPSVMDDVVSTRWGRKQLGRGRNTYPTAVSPSSDVWW